MILRIERVLRVSMPCIGGENLYLPFSSCFFPNSLCLREIMSTTKLPIVSCDFPITLFANLRVSYAIEVVVTK